MNKRGLLRRYYPWLTLGQRLADGLLVFLMLLVICRIQDTVFGQNYQIAAMAGAGLTWISMGAVDAYRRWRGASLWQEVRVIFGAWMLVVGTLFIAAWATKYTENYSRMVIGSWILSTPVLIALLHSLQRYLLRYMRRHGRNTRAAIIVGAGELGQEVAMRIAEADWMGIRVFGYFDDSPRNEGREIKGLPVIGGCDEVYEYVRDRHIDMVYFTLPMRQEKKMSEMFDALRDTTASVFLVPGLFAFELMCAREEDFAGLPVYALCETPMTGPFGTFKRIEDLVLASLILILILPLMAMIAIGIKLTSPGPVLFRQSRHGLNGKEIKVLKFRTMRVCEDGEVIRQAKKNDSRVTPFGAFLRRSSLDELPQFFNVIKGDMSVVGPRPHALAHNEEYRKLIKGYMWRHKVKPGITGWAQVNGWRGETETLDKMKKRVEFDLEYIHNWSLWLDLKIVLQTIFKGFVGKNVY